VLFEVNTDQLVRRVSGRRTCEFCKKVFNVNFAPPGGECIPGRAEHSLVQRPDDQEDTFKDRLRKYEEDTRKPVSHYYAYTGLMRTVDAEGSIDDVTQRLLTALSAGGGKVAAPKKRAQRAAQRRKPAKSRARKSVRRAVRKQAKQAPKKVAAKRHAAAKKRKAARKPTRPARKTRGARRRKSKR
jgi:adenylate kinase